MIEINSNSGKIYVNLDKICYIKEIDDEIVISFVNGMEIRANKSELDNLITIPATTMKLI